MAILVPPNDWLNVEESTRCSFYWQFLVEKWLWQAPIAVPPRPTELSDTGREATSVEALQDGSYVMVPESTASH